jgi:hypothetical protein
MMKEKCLEVVDVAVGDVSSLNGKVGQSRDIHEWQKGNCRIRRKIKGERG